MLLEDAGGGLVTSGSILSPRKNQQLELEEVDDKLITMILTRYLPAGSPYH